MTVIDLNKENIASYVKSRIDFFDQDAILSVYEIGESGEGSEDGDGFINFIYRVWDNKTDRSVIVKQAKSHAKYFSEKQTNFVRERNEMEASLMRLRASITPEYIPVLYDCDPINHTFICEDCGHLGISRFEFNKGKIFPKMPIQVADFLAKNNFYTSELYLEPDVHQRLEARYIDPEMRKVFQCGLFLHDESWVVDEGGGKEQDNDSERAAFAEKPWESRAFRTEMLKLRHIHMAKPECLVHGDLHTSNVMADENDAKIIDMEYTYMGPFSADSGYFLCNYIYQYVRWFFIHDFDQAKCAEMRAYMLSSIKAFIHGYRTIFTDCFEKDARFTYQGRTEYLDYLLETWFSEMCGFIGTGIMMRVGHLVPLPDIDTIEDRGERTEACNILMMIAEHLIMNRENIADTDDLIDRITGITKAAMAIAR